MASKIPPPLPRSKTQPRPLQHAVKDWLDAKEQLKAWEENELALRRYLIAQLFPNAKEGTTSVIRPGIEAKCSIKVYRKVDASALSAKRADLLKRGINLDLLIRQKPELELKAYRELDERKRRIFESVLTITDGTPTLDINPG